MPRTTMVATVLTCLTLTAACGASDPDTQATGPAAATSSVPAATTAVTPTTPASELEGLSAAQVWKKLETDVAKAKSVHVVMSAVDGKKPIKFDLKLSTSGKAQGTMALEGGTITMRRIGKVLYYKADRAFYTKNADAETAKLMAGRWIQTSKGADKDMDEMFSLTYLGPMLKESLKMTASEKKSLKRVPGKEIEGQETVGLRTNSKELDTLYASATGPTLPLYVTAAKSKTEYVKFQDWNQDFSVTKPADAMNLDKAK